MKKFQHDDFTPHDAWLVFRLDTQVADQAADVYMLMELASGYMLSHAISLEEGLPLREAQDFFQTAYDKKKCWPKRVLVAKGDPIEVSLQEIAASKPFKLEFHPASAFEDIIAPAKESFGEHFFSPSSMFHAPAEEGMDQDDLEAAKLFVPDAYDPCPCASGKKYKFCCKPIFREIVGAMSEAEDGRKDKALKYIQEAKKRVGETAEVLCREALVHSFFDAFEFERLLERCLQLFPNHPRANYIKGLELREKQRFDESILFYKKAIENYPRTDRFHLNEAYNNIGTVYYELKDYAMAKASWVQALFLLPSDRMVKRNLLECIYENPGVPAESREMSPMIARLFERRMT